MSLFSCVGNIYKLENENLWNILDCLLLPAAGSDEDCDPMCANSYLRIEILVCRLQSYYLMFSANFSVPKHELVGKKKRFVVTWKFCSFSSYFPRRLSKSTSWVLPKYCFSISFALPLYWSKGWKLRNFERLISIYATCYSKA